MEAYGTSEGAVEYGKDGTETAEHQSVEGQEPESNIQADQPIDKQAEPEDTTWFDAKRFPIKYRQNTYYPKDLDHTRNLLQLGWENDRRLSQLKEREDKLGAKLE